MRCVSFPDNTVLFYKGDKADMFYIILSGEVNAILIDEAGNEKIINTLSVGRSFGERALINKMPRSLTVKTTIASTFITVDRVDFKQILERDVNAQ